MVFSIWRWIMVVNLKFIKIINHLILSLCLAILSNCKDIVRQDEHLSISKDPYLGNDLRLEGYYHAHIQDFIQVYFFYRDGTLLNCGYFPAHQLPQKEQMFQSEIFDETIKKYKYRWGTFSIDNQHIEFENWYASEPPLKVFGKEGKILNDSIFVISKFFQVENGTKILLEELHEIFHFREFSPKPDSINAFVK